MISHVECVQNWQHFEWSLVQPDQRVSKHDNDCYQTWFLIIVATFQSVQRCIEDKHPTIVCTCICSSLKAIYRRLFVPSSYWMCSIGLCVCVSVACLLVPSGTDPECLCVRGSSGAAVTRTHTRAFSHTHTHQRIHNGQADRMTWCEPWRTADCHTGASSHCRLNLG